MRTQTRASSMVEIIIAIGVLAVVSMFVIQLFVKASNIEQKAHDLDIACIEAQTLMEQTKATGSFRPQIHYDKEWTEVQQKDINGFTISMSIKTDGPLNIIDIVVQKNSPYFMEKQNPIVHQLQSGTRLEVNEL